MNVTRQRRILAGLCYWCGVVPSSNSKRCRSCLDKMNAASKLLRATRHAKKLCIECGDKRDSNLLTCKGCLRARMYKDRERKKRKCQTTQL